MVCSCCVDPCNLAECRIRSRCADVHVTTVLVLLLIALIVALLPMVLSVSWALWRRKRDARRSPLTHELRNLPGQQAVQQAELLSDKAGQRMAVSVVAGPLMLALWVILQADLQRLRFDWSALAWVAVALGVSAWAARSAIALLRTRRNYLNGSLGERATAQALLPLIARGCLLYNDVLGGATFNLDHVIVAPDRVYVVETKWRSKPSNGGKGSATVRFDGRSLQFPGWSECEPLDQARAEARWLAGLLYRKTGERVRVEPVLALPGWYVTLLVPESDVHVINPAMHRFMADGKGAPMSAQQRRRVMTVIEECYAAA